MDDCHLSNIEKLEKKKIWCYSFNLSTSAERRRLQYTYFGTVQTFIKLIWDGPTKWKKLNFWGPITNGKKKTFWGTQAPQQINMSHTILCHLTRF
jgi:hypothetical protein